MALGADHDDTMQVLLGKLLGNGRSLRNPLRMLFAQTAAYQDSNLKNANHLKLTSQIIAIFPDKKEVTILWTKGKSTVHLYTTENIASLFFFGQKNKHKL